MFFFKIISTNNNRVGKEATFIYNNQLIRTQVSQSGNNGTTLFFKDLFEADQFDKQTFLSFLDKLNACNSFKELNFFIKLTISKIKNFPRHGLNHINKIFGDDDYHFCLTIQNLLQNRLIVEKIQLNDRQIMLSINELIKTCRISCLEDDFNGKTTEFSQQYQQFKIQINTFERINKIFIASLINDEIINMYYNEFPYDSLIELCFTFFENINNSTTELISENHNAEEKISEFIETLKQTITNNQRPIDQLLFLLRFINDHIDVQNMFDNKNQFCIFVKYLFSMVVDIENSLNDNRVLFYSINYLAHAISLDCLDTILQDENYQTVLEKVTENIPDDNIGSLQVIASSFIDIKSQSDATEYSKTKLEIIDLFDNHFKQQTSLKEKTRPLLDLTKFRYHHTVNLLELMMSKEDSEIQQFYNVTDHETQLDENSYINLLLSRMVNVFASSGFDKDNKLVNIFEQFTTRLTELTN